MKNAIVRSRIEFLQEFLTTGTLDQSSKQNLRFVIHMWYLFYIVYINRNRAVHQKNKMGQGVVSKLRANQWVNNDIVLKIYDKGIFWKKKKVMYVLPPSHPSLTHKIKIFSLFSRHQWTEILSKYPKSGNSGSNNWPAQIFFEIGTTIYHY